MPEVSSSVVKTFQPAKAVGNARRTLRGTMVAFYSDELDESGTENAYGSERRKINAAGDFGTKNIIGVGRLEPVPEGTILDGGRISNKEAYNLFWLPYVYETDGDLVIPNGDYSVLPFAPELQDDDVDHHRKTLAVNMRLWFPTMTTVADGSLPSGFLYAFNVVKSALNTQNQEFELQALVVRDETAPPREWHP